jgi:hypothetical protein
MCHFEVFETSENKLENYGDGADEVRMASGTDGRVSDAGG